MIDRNSIEVERLINTNSIKYDILTPIINEAFTGSNAEEMNIYIDTYSLLKVLYSSIDIKLGSYNNLASCLINLATHYRHFFKTRYNVYANIYFIHSNNTPFLNNKFVKDYNIGHIGKFNAKATTTNYIKSNIEILKLVVQYLPNIYLIESEFESGVVMYDLMCRTDPNNNLGHLILTKDVYNFQLVNMKPQTVILRSKRDSSYFVDRNNVLQCYSKERGVKARSDIMAPDLLTVLQALSSLKERNIPTLFNITRAIKILEEGISSSKILNGYNSDLKYLWDGIEDPSFEVGSTIFEFRFKAIDIQFQHGVYINSVECANMESSLVDKYNPEEIKELNNKHFFKNPLDLNRI